MFLHSTSYHLMDDGDVAQLAECRTVTLLTLVLFSGAARDFSAGHFSAQTLLHVSVQPRVQSHALTYVPTLTCGSYQSFVDYGNIKTPSTHRRLVARLCRS